MSFDTPVAFFIYNRPEYTKIVLDSIRNVKPKILYVIADGPKGELDYEDCKNTRNLFKSVDWNCEVIENYSSTNLGCRNRVSTGLDWVFSLTEEAIILEDDCIPSSSFFNYCRNLLEYYRDDKSVMHIGGTCHFDNIKSRDTSYYFSRYVHIWGWATWKRAWGKYDVEIKTWPRVKKEKLFDILYISDNEKTYWTNIFDLVYENKIDTWDYQWSYACWYNKALAITPTVNMISNIGFGDNATHTKHVNKFYNLPSGNIDKLKHPSFYIKNDVIENMTSEYVYNISNSKIKKASYISILFLSVFARLVRISKRIFNVLNNFSL